MNNRVRVFIAAYPKYGVFTIPARDTIVWLDFEKTLSPVAGEYYVIIEAMEYCLTHGLKKVTICSKYDVVVDQLTGKSAILEPKLISMFGAIYQMSKKFSFFSVRHLPRKKFSELWKNLNLTR